MMHNVYFTSFLLIMDKNSNKKKTIYFICLCLKNFYYYKLLFTKFLHKKSYIYLRKNNSWLFILQFVAFHPKFLHQNIDPLND
jgi:hypothetical protein